MRILLITILLLLPLTAIAEDEVVLPFDYFYGRWVEGHYFDGTIAKPVRKDPAFKWNYSAVDSWLKVNISDTIGNDENWPPNKYRKSPIVNLYFRPAKNWQISLEDLQIYQTYSIWGISDVTYDSTYQGENYLNFNLNSKWQNKQFNILNLKLSHYSYLFDKFYSKGSLRLMSGLDNKSVYSYADIKSFKLMTDSSIYEFDYIEKLYTYESRGHTFSLYNNLEYGLSDNLMIGADLYYERISQTSNRIEFYPERPTDKLDWSNKGRSRNERIIGTLKFSGNYNNIFGSVGLNNIYRREDSYSIFQYYNAEPDEVSERKYESNTGFYNIQTEYFFSAGILTKGDFDNRVILADYNNRYKKMLFHKQFLAQLDGFIASGERCDVESTFLHQFNAKMKLGLFNRFEAGIFADYLNERSPYCRYDYYGYVPTYREEFNFWSSLRFRSYLFDPNKSDWAIDSNDEILFGPMLKAGEIYLNLEFHSKRYVGESGEDIPLFSFDDMDEWFDSYVKYEVACGIGWGIDGSLSYNGGYKDWLKEKPYRLEISVRLINRFNLTFGEIFTDFDWFNTGVDLYYGRVEIFL